MTRRVELVASILDAVFRLVIGGIFIYAALEKIHDPSLFASQVAGYRMLPDVFVGLFALILPMVELVAGVTLVATRWPREAAVLILGLLGMFFIGLTQGLIRGLHISCGCFGEGEEGGGLGTALIRDIVLWGPTLWLVLRPNRWLCSRMPYLGCVLLAVAFLVAGVFAPMKGDHGDVVVEGQGDLALPAELIAMGTNGTVRAEQWTLDFPQALAQARAQNRPMILYAGSKACRFCGLMKGALTSDAFRQWVKGTGIYLSEAHLDETNKFIAQHYQVEFLKSLPHGEGKLFYPYLGVYWPRKDGTSVQRVFVGRRGLMPGKKHPALVGEFVNSLEKLLGDYLKGLKGRSEKGVMGAALRKFEVKSPDGAKVWMEPESGIQAQGSVLKMHVKPPRTGLRITWEGPDGKPLRHQHLSQLVINDDMPAGTYTVRLTKKKTFRPGENSAYEQRLKKDAEEKE